MSLDKPDAQRPARLPMKRITIPSSYCLFNTPQHLHTGARALTGWPAGALQVLHPTGFTARHEWAGVTLRRAPHQRVADLILVKGETFRLQYTIVDKRPPAMMPAATLGEDPQSIRVPYTVTVKVHFAGGDVLDFEPIEHSAPGEYFLFLRDPLKVRNVLAGRLCQPETVSVWKEGGLASECRWSACGSEAQNSVPSMQPLVRRVLLRARRA